MGMLAADYKCVQKSPRRSVLCYEQRRQTLRQMMDRNHPKSTQNSVKFMT